MQRHTVCRIDLDLMKESIQNNRFRIVSILVSFVWSFFVCVVYASWVRLFHSKHFSAFRLLFIRTNAISLITNSNANGWRQCPYNRAYPAFALLRGSSYCLLGFVFTAMWIARWTILLKNKKRKVIQISILVFGRFQEIGYFVIGQWEN